MRKWLGGIVFVLIALAIGIVVRLAPGAGRDPDTTEANPIRGASPQRGTKQSRGNDESPPSQSTPALAPTQRKPAITRIGPVERDRVKEAIRNARANAEAPQQPTQPQPKEGPTDLTLEEQRQAKTEIRKQISDVAPLLAECYELERAKHPDLKGSLELRFTIDGEPGVGGIVTESQIVGGSLSDQSELGTCIKETIYTVKFAPPKQGGTVEVAYPFVFGHR